MERVQMAQGGKITIPRTFRKILNIKNGEELFLTLQDDHIIISSFKTHLTKARQLINRYIPSDTPLADEHIKEHHKEAKREEEQEEQND